jgi:transcriptional regulator with XRE-family HTH domain
VPNKLSNADAWPTLVLDRLVVWGRCIRTQRMQQRITAADLCQRLGISPATLRRLEHGDPGAAVGAYLTALLTLGIADVATPPLPTALWQDAHGQRVKLSQKEKGGELDDDYF